jgi:uncharacterized protein
MSIKIHESYRKVVALADAELIGKRFEEGKRQLDVRENFYRGEVVDGEEVVKMLRSLALDDATFNIVGENSVNAALKSGVITSGNVAAVDGVPFALSLS